MPRDAWRASACCVAEECGRVVGFNLCYALRRRSVAARELMLFEIGVRAEARRRASATR